MVTPTSAIVQGSESASTSETGVGKNVNDNSEVAPEELGPVVEYCCHMLLFSSRPKRMYSELIASVSIWNRLMSAITGSPGISRGMKKLMVSAPPGGEQIEGDALQEVLHQPALRSAGRRPALTARGAPSA